MPGLRPSHPSDRSDTVVTWRTVVLVNLIVIASLAITDANRLNVGMTGACQVVNQPATAVGCAVRSIPLSQPTDQSSCAATKVIRRGIVVASNGGSRYDR